MLGETCTGSDQCRSPGLEETGSRGLSDTYVGTWDISAFTCGVTLEFGLCCTSEMTVFAFFIWSCDRTHDT